MCYLLTMVKSHIFCTLSNHILFAARIVQLHIFGTLFNLIPFFLADCLLKSIQLNIFCGLSEHVPFAENRQVPQSHIICCKIVQLHIFGKLSNCIFCLQTVQSYFLLQIVQSHILNYSLEEKEKEKKKEAVPLHISRYHGHDAHPT